MILARFLQNDENSITPLENFKDNDEVQKLKPKP